MPFSSIGKGVGGELDALTVKREDGAYTASTNEHIVSDGGTITLPSPEPDGMVMVSRQEKYSPIVIGDVEGDTQAKLKSDGAVVFLSDGNSWYATDVTDIRFDDMVHISTKVANDDATIDFIEVFAKDDQYDRYVVYADNLIPGTNDSQLTARVSSNGGRSWDQGTSDYSYANFRVVTDGSVDSGGSGGTDAFEVVVGGTGNDATSNDNSSGQIHISNPSDSTKSTLIQNSSVHHRRSVNEFYSTISGGIRLTQSSVNSIQFLMNSGAIDSGIFSVYGVTR